MSKIESISSKIALKIKVDMNLDQENYEVIKSEGNPIKFLDVGFENNVFKSKPGINFKTNKFIPSDINWTINVIIVPFIHKLTSISL